MGTMVIKYNELDGLTRVANRLTNRLDERISDLNRLKGKINNIDSGGRSNLEEANYFIRKKNQKYQEKLDKLDTFKNKVISFKAEVESADKRIANRISSSTKGFRKANNISISPVSAAFAVMKSKNLIPWNMNPILLSLNYSFNRKITAFVEKTYRDIKYDIKDWYYNDSYEKKKYTVNFIKGTIAAIFWSVVAIAAPSPATIYKAIDSVGEAICDGSAMLWYIRTGDKEYADEIGEMKLNNVISEIIVKPMFKNEDNKQTAEKMVYFTYGSIGLFSCIKDLKDLGAFFKTVPQNIKKLPQSLNEISALNKNFIHMEAKKLNDLVGSKLYDNVSDIKYLLKSSEYKYVLASLRVINDFKELSKYVPKSEDFIGNSLKENSQLVSGMFKKDTLDTQSLERC